MKCKNRGVPTL